LRTFHNFNFLIFNLKPCPPPEPFSLDIPIFAKLYDFYKKLSGYLLLFPKTKKYSLGLRLDTTTLDSFELLFSVPHSKNKIDKLNEISSKLDLLKVLLRLAKDTRALNDSHYLELQTMLQEIGRMLGGWIRAAKQNLP